MYKFCLITSVCCQVTINNNYLTTNTGDQTKLAIILLTDPIPGHCKERSLSEIPVAHALCILGGATWWTSDSCGLYVCLLMWRGAVSARVSHWWSRYGSSWCQRSRTVRSLPCHRRQTKEVRLLAKAFLCVRCIRDYYRRFMKKPNVKEASEDYGK